MKQTLKPGTRCDGFTRTGEHDMGAPVMRPCSREAEYACTTPKSEGYHLYCRHHKAAWLRKPYYRDHGIVEALSKAGAR